MNYKIINSYNYKILCLRVQNNNNKTNSRAQILEGFLPLDLSLAFGFNISVLFDSYLIFMIFQPLNISTTQKSTANQLYFNKKYMWKKSTANWSQRSDTMMLGLQRSIICLSKGEGVLWAYLPLSLPPWPLLQAAGRSHVRWKLLGKNFTSKQDKPHSYRSHYSKISLDTFIPFTAR